MNKNFSNLSFEITELRKDIQYLSTELMLRKDEKIIDKLELFHANVKKTETMLNELKGVISMARAAVAERKVKDK